MSILIKGMEMPKSCYECKLDLRTDVCSAFDEWHKENPYSIPSNCRLPDCPLKELPPAQPEIITCIECKYYDTDTEQCNNDKGLRFIDFSNPERMWCPWAERWEEGDK